MITYDSFVSGKIMGVRDMVLDAPMLAAWEALFPEDEAHGAMPHGMMAVISMRAYAEILQPRPPGNIHAVQRFDLVRRPQQGERLTTTITCIEKDMRKGRGWVTLGMETTGTEGPAFTGRMTVIWAA